VRGTNSRQTFYYWCYYVYQTHTLIWPTRQKIVVEVIVSTFKSRLSLPSEIDSFSFTLLLLFFPKVLRGLPVGLTHNFAGFMTPSQTTQRSGRPAMVIQFYNWKTGLMLSTSGIEMMMGILFQQTPWCFITNIGECPTYGFFLGQALFSNVMCICCLPYELNSCQFDYTLSQFAIVFP